MKGLKTKSAIITICLVLIFALFTACKSEEKSDKRLKVVTTIFPVYDWTLQILNGDDKDVDVSMLLSNGTDLHSYQPNANDIRKISNCDVFIYVGGESDEWVDDVLKEAKNKKMKVVNLMDVLGDRLKEEDNEDSKDREYDEHIWLSVRNAKLCSEAIEKAMSEINPKNADLYRNNLEEYQEKLQDLDNSYQELVSKARQKTLIFGDRFPFRYLLSDYELSYYAAFSGCSSETEASFSTIKFLADKVDKLGIKHVIIIEKSSKKIADTIIENTKNKNQDVLTLDSMQSITEKDIKAGADYIKIMEKNLKTLKKALN